MYVNQNLKTKHELLITKKMNDLIKSTKKKTSKKLSKK